MMMRFFGFMQSMVIIVTMFALATSGASAQQGSDTNNPLAVPAVNFDESGMFTVENCPTTHDVLEVVLNEGESAIDLVAVFADDMPMTTIPLSDDYDITRNVVHYLDANFDGYVDILVGPGCNREYSVLLLWDCDKNDFVLASNDGFVVFNGNFYFDPQRKAVYRMTSSSAFETTCTLMTWFGSDLQSEQTFLQVFDPTYYDSYRVTHRYTIRNYYSDEDIISTDNPSDISAPWDRWIVEE